MSNLEDETNSWTARAIVYCSDDEDSIVPITVSAMELYPAALALLMISNGNRENMAVVSALRIVQYIKSANSRSMDVLEICQNGEQIASDCMSKYGSRVYDCNRPVSGWHIIFVPELKSFVGVSHGHKDLPYDI